MRLLGRDRIRRIRNCEPERLDAVELRAVCEMAELHRQHVRRCEKRESQVERTSKSKNQYLNPDEAYRIWLLVAAEAERDRKAGLKMSRAITTELVYLLMAGAGLRVDEVCNLTFEGCPVHHGNHNLDFVGKGNKQRLVAISQELERRLTEYAIARREVLGRKYRESIPVLANQGGRPLRPDSVYKRFKRLGKKAGVMLTRRRKSGTFFSPHKCRHTAALWMLDISDNMQLVKDQLGHEKIDTTAIYARTLTHRRQGVLDRLHNRLFGGGNGENGQ